MADLRAAAAADAARQRAAEGEAAREARNAEKKAKEKAQRKARSIAAAGFLYGGRCDYLRGEVGAERGGPCATRGGSLPEPK